MARGRVLGGLLLLCAALALLGPFLPPSEGETSEAKATLNSQIFDLAWFLFRHWLCACAAIGETLKAVPKEGLLSALKDGMEASRDCRQCLKLIPE